MLSNDQLAYVERMTKMQLDRAPFQNVMDIARELISQLQDTECRKKSAQEAIPFTIGSGNSPPFTTLPTSQEPYATPFYTTPDMQWTVAGFAGGGGSSDTIGAGAGKAGSSTEPELRAPTPKTPEVGEIYDSMVGASMLPNSDNLPRKFGTTDYSAMKINSQTIAMSIEHYFDLLAVRDECRTLREDKVRLEAMMMESARRHVAVESLVNLGGFTVRPFEDQYMVIWNCTGVKYKNKSLTECLEAAAKDVAYVNSSEYANAEVKKYFSVQELARDTIDDEQLVEELELEIQQRRLEEESDQQPAVEQTMAWTHDGFEYLAETKSENDLVEQIEIKEEPQAGPF